MTYRSSREQSLASVSSLHGWVLTCHLFRASVSCATALVTDGRLGSLALVILPCLCLYDVGPKSNQKVIGSPHNSLSTITPMAHPVWMVTSVTLAKGDHG